MALDRARSTLTSVRRRGVSKRGPAWVPPAPRDRRSHVPDHPVVRHLSGPEQKTSRPPPQTLSRSHPSRPAPVPAAKTSEEWDFEHFVAFEKACGNADRIAERIEEARSYEPEQAPPEYVW